MRNVVNFIVGVINEQRERIGSDDSSILMQADLHDLKRQDIIDRLTLKGHEVKLK